MELKGLPEGEKTIGSRWVLSLKLDKDGNITKTKARVVAKGLTQREAVTYNQTAAPAPAAASVKTALAVGNQMGFTIYHLHVKQAYTKGRLDNQIVMKLPGGCGQLSGKYVDLEKALYGLKQSGLLWNDLLIGSPCMEWNIAWPTLACFV